jgi:tRNA(adenine34) deaminase
VDYKQLMQQAIELAKGASNFNDVPVGALIVNEQGEILATGQNLRENKNDPTAHAEMVAIKKAGIKIGTWRLNDLTMVVTLEPCAMCAGAILQARLKRLVFGAFNINFGAVGSVNDLLRDPRNGNKIEIYSGVNEKACIAELDKFFKRVRLE